jgi:hypothetical protein
MLAAQAFDGGQIAVTQPDWQWRVPDDSLISS